MKKAFLIAAGLLLVITIGYFFRQKASCFASSGAVELPQDKEILKGQPLSLKFRMMRISGPGCFTGRASESYKDVSCGYRIGEKSEWKTAHISVLSDSETEYAIQCLIPPVTGDFGLGATLDYYFEYSAWGNPPEKKSASLIIR